MSSIPKPNLGALEKRAMQSLEGFKAFILRGNVVDLAIGIVIGAAFTSVVTAFVTDVITPLIPAGKTNLSGLIVPLPYGTGLKLGEFINAVISFLIVATVLYFFVVRPVAVMLERYKPQKVESTKRDCPYCCESIPLQATRCSHCTSSLLPISEDAGAMPASPVMHFGHHNR
ncbi:MAG: large conductance mechanosensitive channel protein MscL [Ktedonobacteraceae bacterium]